MEENRVIEIRSQKTYRRKFTPPPVHPDEWCDFRVDYESGMTLLDISRKYYCDPRTVKACIMHNKSSADLGKHAVPGRLAPYEKQIRQYAAADSDLLNHPNISRITREIFTMIKADGYTGSQRTVRNYLMTLLKPKNILKEDKSL